jgi:hypothetical protein
VLNISPKLKGLRLAAVFAAGLFCFLSASSAASGQNSRPGHVIGNIDGISRDGDQYFISGWACQQGRSDSIQLHVYVDRSAYGTPPGTLAVVGWANFDNEPGVSQACQDRAHGQHRFFVALPPGVERQAQQGKLFVHGIRVVDGVPNAAIGGSGSPLHSSPAIGVPFNTPTVPPVSGTYRHLAEHPRVFTTADELRTLASRVNQPSTYSALRFSGLANQIKHDLANKIDWDAAYSGCDIDVYLRVFSFEPRGGYISQVRSEDQLRAALHVRPGYSAPDGAAVVASRLALYAALAKAGAILPPSAPSAADAAVLAKRILLAWAAHGFRDTHGNFLPPSAFRCEDKSHPQPDAKNTVGTDIPLQIGRGVIYSAQAQDLLQYVGALNEREEVLLSTFHLAMFDLIRHTGNKSLGTPHPACERFANGTAVALASLLAIARLVDDQPRFTAVLLGGNIDVPVALPWTRFFDGNIYGDHDHPMPCYPNGGPDGLHTTGAFTTSSVAPGEIQDRYRGLLLQTFGYPMGSLQWLFDAAETLRIAGYDSFAYRGNHNQSIEMAVQYYSCYGKTPGFYATVTRENARSCPNFEQYYGKIVNGVDGAVIFGSYRFPGNAAITSVESTAKAKAPTGAFSRDAILFGKWRD